MTPSIQNVISYKNLDSSILEGGRAMVEMKEFTDDEAKRRLIFLAVRRYYEHIIYAGHVNGKTRRQLQKASLNSDYTTHLLVYDR